MAGTGLQVTVERYGPDERIPDPHPGDFILTHGKTFFSWLIRVGQRLRYRGKDRKYTRWNHAALIVDGNGDIIEALGVGVKRRNIADYDPTEYHVVRLVSVSPTDRAQEVAFATYSLNQAYGWVTIASITLALLTGMKFRFSIDGQEICSGLVARALERTGEIFPEDPWHMMPASLAKYYNAEPPGPGVPIGRPVNPKR